MLTIHVDAKELFDERTSTFTMISEKDIRLEHSLISLSRWESKWKKPFLSLENPTPEELADYICCMSVDQSIDFQTAMHLSFKSLNDIKDYISDTQTATKIYDRRQGKGKKDIITSEVIYYWMIYYGIPFECQKWHLNRLLTLIRVCGIKGGTANQAMDMNSIFAQNTKLNAARRAARMNGK